MGRRGNAALPGFGRALLGGGDGAGDGGGAEFAEAEGEADLFHHGDAEVGFVGGGVFDVAVGFVDAYELRTLLEFFFGGGHNNFRLEI